MDVKDIEPVFSTWTAINSYHGFTNDILSTVLQFKKNKNYFNKFMFIPICIIIISYLRKKSSRFIKSLIVAYDGKRIRFSQDALKILKSIKQYQKEGEHKFIYRKSELQIEILLEHNNINDAIRRLIKEDLWEIDETIIVNIVDYRNPDIRVYSIEIEKKS